MRHKSGRYPKGIYHSLVYESYEDLSFADIFKKYQNTRPDFSNKVLEYQHPNDCITRAYTIKKLFNG